LEAAGKRAGVFYIPPFFFFEKNNKITELVSSESADEITTAIFQLTLSI
jgi:hypothetical protein